MASPATAVTPLTLRPKATLPVVFGNAGKCQQRLIEGKGNMKASTLNTITILSACASGAFAILIVIIFLGAVTTAIPLWLVEWIAARWGIVCLSYVLTQLPIVFAALSAENKEFKVDRYTSWLPLAASLVFALLFFSVSTLTDLWIMMIENFITSVADLTLMWILARIRKNIP